MALSLLANRHHKLPPTLHVAPDRQELFPGTYLPTPTHYFMRLLHDKGLLLRCYTQVGNYVL